MRGMVDLHSHVLPGLDDGPAGMDESVRMLQALQAMGFDAVFATPHHRLTHFNGLQRGKVTTLLRRLRLRAERKGIGLQLYPGMEYDLDETVVARAASGLAMGPYILVDMGFWSVPRNLGFLLGEMTGGGYRVLLAHPERNDSIMDAVGTGGLDGLGVLPVGNLGSLCGQYGRRVRDRALRWLHSGGYWAMASDLHSEAQVDWIARGLEVLSAESGHEGADLLLRSNPGQVLASVKEESG